MVRGRASRRSLGYTLTEMMVTSAIVGIISAVGFQVMNKSTQTQMMATALANIQQGAFTSFDVMSKLLRQAQGNSIVIDRLDANQPPWSRITFTLPNRTGSYQFYQKGQTFYIGSSPQLSHLRVLTFSYPNSSVQNVISVSMTFEQGVGSGRSKAVQLYIQNIGIKN